MSSVGTYVIKVTATFLSGRKTGDTTFTFDIRSKCIDTTMTAPTTFSPMSYVIQNAAIT
jgi:hypothetical protein